MSDTAELSPEACHNPLLDRAPRILAFDPEAYLPEWQSAARRSFKQLLGSMPARVPLDLRITAETHTPIAREIHFTFTAELHADIPAVLLIPKNAATPVPCIICQQGHGDSMATAIGRPTTNAESASVARGNDLAIQAVQNGFAALAFDLRAFATRADQRPPNPGQNRCHHAAMTALLVGRTLAGERVWDISRAIDALETFPEIDKSRIACLGHSGGGIVSFYAAAFDPRVAAVCCSCCICTYRDSIAAIDHCADNYLPGILHYFELADLAGLIAPRPLIIVAGESDPIFPAAGVRQCVADIRAIYTAQNAQEKFTATFVPGPHQFSPAAAWSAFRPFLAETRP